MGSFLSRTLLMAFGYAYPAYHCFKSVENNKPEYEELRFWCQYWILVAILTVYERIGDAVVSWLPLYNEAKLAFVIYLWYPKWKGTTYIYNYFLRPYVVRHETEIDRNLFELQVKAGEVGILYWHKAMRFGQTRVFDMLQCFSSQQAPNLNPNQNPKEVKSLASSNKASLTKPEQLKQPPSDFSSEEQSETRNERDFLLASQNNKSIILGQSCVRTTSQSSVNQSETGEIQATSISSLGNGDANSCQELQTKAVVSKGRGIWRIFKCSAVH